MNILKKIICLLLYRSQQRHSSQDNMKYKSNTQQQPSSANVKKQPVVEEPVKYEPPVVKQLPKIPQLTVDVNKVCMFYKLLLLFC